MDLVTGATGHIGNVLVSELLKRGEKVRALVLPGDNTICLQGLDVEIVMGNVLNLEDVRQDRGVGVRMAAGLPKTGGDRRSQARRGQESLAE